MIFPGATMEKLVADVKRNILYFGWPSPKHQQIKLDEINDETALQLKQQLTKWIARNCVKFLEATRSARCSRAGGPFFPCVYAYPPPS